MIQGGRDKLNQGGWLDARDVGVDLIDGYVKALRRRAEACEKWVEAGKDWEVLAGGGGGVGDDWIGEVRSKYGMLISTIPFPDPSRKLCHSLLQETPL